MTFIELSPELARLAQLKTRSTGQPLVNELARQVTEETILNLDPELDLIVEGASSLSEIDALVSAVGVNSVLVNGREIDVRPIDQDGRISCHRALIGTPYMAAGTLVVKMDGTRGGTVIAHIGPGNWLSAESGAGQDEYVSLNVQIDSKFDLSETLASISRAPKVDFAQGLRSLPDKSELEKFLFKRGQLIMARQKQIITAVATNETVREMMVSASESLPPAKVTLVLNHSAVWAARVEGTVKRLSERFPEVKREDITKAVLEAGEKFGGQPDAPEFRRHVAQKVGQLDLARKFSGAQLESVKSVLADVLGGKSAQEAVGKIVKNKVAVAVAEVIRRERGRLDSFAQATAEEIGGAFQKLAVQPAYATHSSNPESGIESINEAIELLEASKVAEKIEEIDLELARF